ncbi:hypothetical protein JZ751_025793 [Albula glossodonta]|uniref:Regulator of G-protein signaling 1 n=1 Tax=Albula glossodonta TaxID=121402 RepID=A0A8T2NDN0_9TELE|nr:hypothetical protein JZ751_025793 [Albula glossodonta]
MGETCSEEAQRHTVGPRRCRLSLTNDRAVGWWWRRAHDPEVVGLIPQVSWYLCALEIASQPERPQEFLKTEYSEENILFWLEIEEYKKIKSTEEMIATANRIFSEFVEVESPKQINIDCGTRESITKNISQPNLESFDKAQRLIYSLMARDCYPRFLKSDIYQGLLQRKKKR